MAEIASKLSNHKSEVKNVTNPRPNQSKEKEKRPGPIPALGGPIFKNVLEIFLLTRESLNIYANQKI